LATTGISSPFTGSAASRTSSRAITPKEVGFSLFGEYDRRAELPPTQPYGGLPDVYEDSGLSHRQRAALPVVAFAPSIAQAARFSGIAESTLRRWLANPDFRQCVDRMREETVYAAHQEFKGLLPSCAAVFADAMQSPDPALRLRAARYAISFILRLNEADRLSADLQGLQSAARNS